MIHKDDHHAFNREMIELWRNQNPNDQIKVKMFLLKTIIDQLLMSIYRRLD